MTQLNQILQQASPTSRKSSPVARGTTSSRAPVQESPLALGRPAEAFKAAPRHVPATPTNEVQQLIPPQAARAPPNITLVNTTPMEKHAKNDAPSNEGAPDDSSTSRYKYHPECVGRLRSRGITQACPSCRAELVRIEQLYEDAVRRWLLVLSRVKWGVASWGNLSEQDQLEMNTCVGMMREAAETGLVDAQVALGQMLDQGQGVPQNSLLALRWLRAAAAQGDATAQTQLAIMYHRGRPGVRPDYELALECYQMAADQGKAEAMLNLGVVYRDGLGTPQDFGRALWWFREAAERGITDGEYNVGRMLATGRGAPQDLQAAASMYHRAADKGSTAAMCALGSMYRDGLGVKQSNRTAFWYFGMAADLGDVRAKAITNEMQAAKQKRQEQLRNSRIQIATRSIYEER